MSKERLLDCGPALFGGYRVALLCGLRCEGQALLETANDVAACAALRWAAEMKTIKGARAIVARTLPDVKEETE